MYNLIVCYLTSTFRTFHLDLWFVTFTAYSSGQPHTAQEIESKSPKINLLCVFSHDTVIGQFAFAETANIYLDILQTYAIPQMHNLQPTIIFEQYGAPPQ